MLLHWRQLLPQLLPLRCRRRFANFQQTQLISLARVCCTLHAARYGQQDDVDDVVLVEVDEVLPTLVECSVSCRRRVLRSKCSKRIKIRMGIGSRVGLRLLFLLLMSGQLLPQRKVNILCATMTRQLSNGITVGERRTRARTAATHTGPGGHQNVQLMLQKSMQICAL